METQQPESLSFNKVYEEEWKEIRVRRTALYYPTASLGNDRNSPESLVGLALSGGGIRSATFCLGVLQGMHKLKLLRIFDYLSTVSGGGYVGGWWSAWLSRNDVYGRTSDNKSSTFQDHDIKNVSSLAVKLRDSQDKAPKYLRKHFDVSTRAELAKYKDGDYPSMELRETLLKELRNAQRPRFEPVLLKDSIRVKQVPPDFFKEIKKAKLISQSPPDFFKEIKKVKLTEEAKRSEEIRQTLALIANNDSRFRWLNRIILEEAYPYELSDIFPPREAIEPVRWKEIKAEQSSDTQIAAGKESETSLCAWQDPIHHLRLFANYLTPRRGVLSADTWRAVSTISRNLTLTWLILLPILMAVVLLGQSYFLLRLGRCEFLGVGPNPNPMLSEGCSPDNVAIFTAILIPLAIILGILVVLALAWLFCNRDSTSITDLIIQGICIVALLILAAAGVNVYISISDFVLNPIFLGSMALAIGLWCYMVFWNPGDKGAGLDDHAMKARWAKEMRRNRISRWQTRFQIIFVAVAIVLTISGFSSYLLRRLFPETAREGWKFTISLSLLLPIIPAVAGSIFTAMKSTPTGGGDKRETREPSAISRFIFAVTPVLVILVLAIGVALTGNALLTYIFNKSAQFSERFDFLKSMAALFGVTLCLALALYELDVDIKPTVGLISFGAWLAFLASWTGFAVYTFLYTQIPLLFYFFIIIAAIVCFMVFTRVVVRGKWKIYLKRKHWVLGLLSAAVIGLAGVLPAKLSSIFHWICVKTPGGLKFEGALELLRGWASVHLDLIPRALPLVLSALAFSFVVFRLGVKRSEGNPPFKLRFLKNNALGKKRESLYLYASLCLMLPVAAVCWLRALQMLFESHWVTMNMIALIAFPFIIAPLPEIIILIYRLTDKRSVNKAEHAPVNDIVQPDQAARKIPTVIHGLLSYARQYREQASWPLVMVGLGAVLLVGFAAKSQTNESTVLPDLLIVVIAFTTSISLFTVVLTRQDFLPLTGSNATTGTPESGVSKFKLYWKLILACLVLTISVGYLMRLVSPHVIEHNSLPPPVIERVLLLPLDSEHSFFSPPVIGKGSLSRKGIEMYSPLPPLATTVLPGMAICLTMIFAEMYWGKSENRHSVWLISATYAALFLLFMLSVWPTRYDQPREIINSLNSVLGLVAVALVWVVALGWMVDPNSVSMHQFYRARLVRAYLGASNIRRRKQGKEITEAAPGDDLPLSLVKTCRRGGPHHLLNTTLNLVGGRDLATAQRSASNFVLSSRFCGSLRTNYRPTSQYMKGELTLGTAVAASGAAVSPSMGSKKPTAALAMLLTLLNVRLGYWAPTPNRDNWTSSQPKLWPFYLMREFLSQTNDVSSYCYLTDGGHFDNTGLYSLVERGCRFIVLVDCAADPEPACFQDLGDAIRRCRIDFGTEIKINLDPFIKSRSIDGFQPFTVGGIRYSHRHAKTLGWYSKERLDKLLWKREPDEYSPEDKDYRSGTIIYFKPSIMGKETADVRQYAIENKDFPQQATTNQWFDEAQFESYRRLGQFCAKLAFEGLETVRQIQYKAKLSPTDIKAIFEEISDKESIERSQSSTENHFDSKPIPIRTAC